MVCKRGAVDRNDDVVGAGFPNFVDLLIEVGGGFGVDNETSFASRDLTIS